MESMRRIRSAGVFAFLAFFSSCAQTSGQSLTLDAVDALLRLPTLLDYRAVAETLGVTVENKDVSEYSQVGERKEPAVLLAVNGQNSQRFPGLRMNYWIHYSGRKENSHDKYFASTAYAWITLYPDSECVRFRDAVRRYGQPSSTEIRKEIALEASYEWILTHTSRRRVVLSLPRLSTVATNDVNLPKLTVGGMRRTECEAYGVGLEEVRPEYRFSDVPGSGADVAFFAERPQRPEEVPPKLKNTTREALHFGWKGPYPRRGAVVATSGFMSFGSDWIVADLDRRVIRCIYLPDTRKGLGGPPASEKADALPIDQVKEIRRALEDAEKGIDTAAKKTGFIADEPVTTVAVFTGERVLLGDDTGSFHTLPTLVSLLKEIAQRSCKRNLR